MDNNGIKNKAVIAMAKNNVYTEKKSSLGGHTESVSVSKKSSEIK